LGKSVYEPTQMLPLAMKNTIQAAVVAFVISVAMACSEKSSSEVSPNSATGTAGSMARFAIVDNSLYTVLPNKLQVYDIGNPAVPVVGAAVSLNIGLETIFPYKNNLFIGANDGMYIFDNTQPAAPTLLSRFSHVQSCDPVVVEGNYAYVTLRGGVVCRRFGTQSSLDVVDITDLRNPKLVHSQILQSPYGLGVDGTQLFVCEGDAGLKVFDISKPTQPILKNIIPNVKSYDVILLNKSLLVIGSGGLYQYNYKDSDKLELLSKIAVEN
jgi:hypothetical protein